MGHKKEGKKDPHATNSKTADDRKKQAVAGAAHKCVKCMQTFSNTTRQPELEQHVESKHSKGGTTLKDCFPAFTPA